LEPGSTLARTPFRANFAFADDTNLLLRLCWGTEAVEEFIGLVANVPLSVEGRKIVLGLTHGTGIVLVDVSHDQHLEVIDQLPHLVVLPSLPIDVQLVEPADDEAVRDSLEREERGEPTVLFHVAAEHFLDGGVAILNVGGDGFVDLDEGRAAFVRCSLERADPCFALVRVLVPGADDLVVRVVDPSASDLPTAERAALQETNDRSPDVVDKVDHARRGEFGGDDGAVTDLRESKVEVAVVVPAVRADSRPVLRERFPLCWRAKGAEEVEEVVEGTPRAAFCVRNESGEAENVDERDELLHEFHNEHTRTLGYQFTTFSRTTG
jgi:hypothetical protein